MRGIIYKDGKMLLAKFRQDDGSEGDYWGTFGGGVDDGESLMDALHREMIEETGIAPEVGKLLFIQQFVSERHEFREELEFFFHVKNADDYAAVDLTATSHGMTELTRAEFIEPAGENVLPAFLRTIDIADYIEHDRPVYIANEL